MARLVAAVGAYLAMTLFVQGALLSLNMCALGGCSEPEDATLGGRLVIAAGVVAVATVVAAPRIARVAHPWRRSLAGLPAAVAAVPASYAVHLPARIGVVAATVAVLTSGRAGFPSDRGGRPRRSAGGSSGRSDPSPSRSE